MREPTMGARWRIRGRRAAWILSVLGMSFLSLFCLLGPSSAAAPFAGAVERMKVPKRELVPSPSGGGGAQEVPGPKVPSLPTKKKEAGGDLSASQGELGRAAAILQKKAEATKFFWERGALLERSESLVSVHDIRGTGEDLAGLLFLWREFVRRLPEQLSLLSFGEVAGFVATSGASLLILGFLFVLRRWFRRWMITRRERISGGDAGRRLGTTVFGLHGLVLATVPKLLLLAAVLFAVRIFRLDDQLRTAAVVVIGGVTFFVFLRVLIREIVLPPGNALRPFRISSEAAESIRPAVLRILTFCAWTLIPIVALDAFSYRPGFVALLWTVFWVGLLTIVLSVASREVLHFVLKPVAGEEHASRVLSAPVHVYRYSLLGLMVFLLLLHGFGYRNLTFYLIVGLFFSGLIVALGRTLLQRLEPSIERAFRQGGPAERLLRMEPALTVRLGRTAQALARWGVYAAVVLTLMILWGIDIYALAWLLTILVTPVGTVGGVPLSISNFLKVGVIVFVFWWLSRYVRHLIHSQIDPDVAGESMRSNLALGIHYFVLALGIILALHSVGVDFTTLTIFAGVLGIGVGFGLQTIANNLISGIILLMEQTVKPSDFIEVGDTTGVVQQITLRSTVVRTLDNISVIVPNSNFIANTVINWSHGDKLTRGRVPVGVAYGSDTALVHRCLLEVAGENPMVLKHPAPRVLFVSFGDSSLNFELLYWVQEPRGMVYIKSELLFAIDAKFRQEGVKIPFPQRDVHIFHPERGIREARRSEETSAGREEGASPPDSPLEP